jgi:tripartite-type tricarboxylate transporter receptor subunit TctC
MKRLLTAARQGHWHQHREEVAARCCWESGGAEAVGMTPAQFLARIKSDAERYKRVIQKAGVKPG